jgi:hypothetical protein
MGRKQERNVTGWFLGFVAGGAKAIPGKLGSRRYGLDAQGPEVKYRTING